ncbi:outer dense fiber protein 3-like protein 2 [Episyrphus balteatus]|uniref:outer dense fiber protein 3-like protein 2 n=1 Tax=Episyrphus balteatus TaxID=286459 RepID=UPI0024863BB4|nr:outer dense fiber protein 3-like protein 2 [Episyrphus balteatus]
MNTKSRGPGPGAYLLPPNVGFTNHDVRKQRKPQYSFGQRLGSSNRTIGPGPGGYRIEKITRYGNDGTPRYTMRPQTFIKEEYKSPGPCSNDVHKKPFFKGRRAPAFSLQSKHYAIYEKIVSPASNTYNVHVQVIKPRPPEYTMAEVLTRKPTIRSPGPAIYGRTDLNVKLKKSPAFSITGRNIYSFKPCGIASTRYDISYYRPGRNSISYSFGTKHSDYAPPMILPCDNLH